MRNLMDRLSDALQDERKKAGLGTCQTCGKACIIDSAMAICTSCQRESIWENKSLPIKTGNQSWSSERITPKTN